MPARVIHTIPPVYDERSRILILGTIPSPKSREQGFYYGHPRNRFWQVLAQVLQAPLPQTIEQKQALLLAHGIALWDVLHACTIEGAGDASIHEEQPNDLSLILRTAQIRMVFTTGSKAASLYRRHMQEIGLPMYALPSTSPANCACSISALIEAYKEILTYLEDKK